MAEQTGMRHRKSLRRWSMLDKPSESLYVPHAANKHTPDLADEVLANLEADEHPEPPSSKQRTSNDINSVISVSGDKLAAAIPIPPNHRPQDSESFPLARNSSRSPRKHAEHRISHLIKSFRNLHIPHHGSSHDHRNQQDYHDHHGHQYRQDYHEPHNSYEQDGHHNHRGQDDHHGFRSHRNRRDGEGSDHREALHEPVAVNVVAESDASKPSWDMRRSQHRDSESAEERRRLRRSWGPGSEVRHSKSPLRRFSVRAPATPRPPPTSSTPSHHNRPASSEARLPREDASRTSSDKARAESRTRNESAAEHERRAIQQYCKERNFDVKEMNSDGHCLYAAVADQLNILAKSEIRALGDPVALTYRDTRKAAAATMRGDPDTYMPFISDSDEKMAGINNHIAGTTGGEDQSEFFLGYCDAVEKTAVWGGQPEILALSRAYRNPIVVVQADTSPLKFGEEFDAPPAYIAFYRAAYGMGEHYNSLQPHTHTNHVQIQPATEQTAQRPAR